VIAENVRNLLATRSGVSHPRLTYVGDVPVEAGFAGSQVLFRLFFTYPADRLTIVESNIQATHPERRLPGVRYLGLDFPACRLLYTRLGRGYAGFLTLSAPYFGRRLTGRVRHSRPDALVTIAHGFGWMAAMRAASQLKLPLHVIVHDHWKDCISCGPLATRRAEMSFARLYRQAASRLCISPAMAEQYEREFGCPATVLYPSRSPYAGGIRRLKRPTRPFTFSYAGSVGSRAYAALIGRFGRIVTSAGGRFALYGNIDSACLSAAGIDQGMVQLRGTVPASDFITRLSLESDALLLPMSFEREHRSNMSLSFPSKLADYTSTGLPIVIWGPPYCSATRWAGEHPGAALAVDVVDDGAIEVAVRKLMAEPKLCSSLGTAAARAGDRCFSPAAASRIFLRAITAEPAREVAVTGGRHD